MISDIATLTWWASFWDITSVVSAAFVLAGVVGESVADFDTLAICTRLAPRPALPKVVEKVGLLILIAALAVEVVAAIGSHTTNEEIIATLNTELDQTIQHDIALTKLTNVLRLSNDTLAADIKDQKARDDLAIASLKDEEARLTASRKEAVENAKRSADSADFASKTAANMENTLNAERSMQETIRRVITPRDLATAHEVITNELSPFAPMRVDILTFGDTKEI